MVSDFLLANQVSMCLAALNVVIIYHFRLPHVSFLRLYFGTLSDKKHTFDKVNFFHEARHRLAIFVFRSQSRPKLKGYTILGDEFCKLLSDLLIDSINCHTNKLDIRDSRKGCLFVRRLACRIHTRRRKNYT